MPGIFANKVTEKQLRVILDFRLKTWQAAMQTGLSKTTVRTHRKAYREAQAAGWNAYGQNVLLCIAEGWRLSRCGHVPDGGTFACGQTAGDHVHKSRGRNPSHDKLPDALAEVVK